MRQIHEDSWIGFAGSEPAQCRKSRTAIPSGWHNHRNVTAWTGEFHRLFHEERVSVRFTPGYFKFLPEIFQCFFTTICSVRRIADDGVEAAGFHDGRELHRPVEGVNAHEVPGHP